MINTGSWAIACDLPEELQFCAFIGQRENFRVDSDVPSRSSAETEWRQWWTFLPANIFGVRFESIVKDNPGIPVDDLLRRIDPRESGYDPPEFAGLENMPTVQKLCRTHWPFFYTYWGNVDGQKTRLIAKLQTQLRLVRLDRLVRVCTWRARKFTSRPFRLRVDFVIWPEDYQVHVSNTHLILGVQYLEPKRTADVRSLLKEYVTRLV